jgi:hypothetical protein
MLVLLPVLGVSVVMHIECDGGICEGEIDHTVDSSSLIFSSDGGR